MRQTIKIGNHTIGDGHKPFVIAEVAQSHDGSIGLAHAFIDLAAECGADAIKFQTHIAAAESTLDETFRVPLSGQDATRYEYWKRMEFTKEAWAGLSKHAADKGLVFLSTPFSIEAINLLESLGAPAWKVGSGEFRSDELLKAMMKTGKPILLSTGMSRMSEIEASVDIFRAAKIPHALLQCTSLYPTPIEKVGINVIDELRAKYDVPIGFSDHSASPIVAIAALARGANIYEAHLTFHKQMYGPDVPASLTPDEFKMVTQARDVIATLNANPVSKDKLAVEMTMMRELFTKSVAPAAKFKAGEIITEEMLVPKKPGTGIPYAERNKLIGLTLAKDVTPDRLLRWEDVGQEKQKEKKHG
jgi:N,N'-diacetyllegionaminate synthase